MGHPEVESIDNIGLEDNLGMLGMGVSNSSLSKTDECDPDEESYKEGGYVPEPSLSTPQKGCDVEPVGDTDLGNNLGMPIPNHPEVPEVCDNPVQTGTHQHLDRNQLSDRVDEALDKLGWSIDEILDYLVAMYKKRSRQFLTDAELRDFLCYLEAQSPEPAAVKKSEDSEDVEEAIAPLTSVSGVADIALAPLTDVSGSAVADVSLEAAPLSEKTSIAVTESTHQFDAGDRVHHPEFGAGTLNNLIGSTAFCNFDEVRDSTGRMQRNAMRSPRLEELTRL